MRITTNKLLQLLSKTPLAGKALMWSPLQSSQYSAEGNTLAAPLGRPPVYLGACRASPGGEGVPHPYHAEGQASSPPYS